MTLRVVGCSHQHSSVAMREQLAFSADQAGEALDLWKRQFPDTEAVLLSTCNRVEFYAATETHDRVLSHRDIAGFLADYHHLSVDSIAADLFDQSGEDAVRHLFAVASSLDSMVVGEPQILAQVKQAYKIATERNSAGPITHGAFQAAVKVARRVIQETTVHNRRVSIASVAVTDFASQIFERFDDKKVLVVGAGDTAEETLHYLQDLGARDITVINHNPERAAELARRFSGQSEPWRMLHSAISVSDLVISTTGASEPILTAENYRLHVDPHRRQRPLFILDLAIPRDVEAEVGRFLGVYLYCIDDLSEACGRNRHERKKELPAALSIVEEETRRFMADWHRRATGPTIARLRRLWQDPKNQELERLFHKLPDIDQHQRDKIAQFADRLVNKLLHPPLESLRDESRNGPPHRLLDVLRRLFKIED